MKHNARIQFVRFYRNLQFGGFFALSLLIGLRRIYFLYVGGGAVQICLNFFHNIESVSNKVGKMA